jgi:hypothetical protein
MITGDAVPASHYTITGVSPRRHTPTHDFAGALSLPLALESRTAGGPPTQ